MPQIDTVILEDKTFPNGGGFSSSHGKNYGGICYNVYREEQYGTAMYVWAEKIYPDQRPPVRVSLGSLNGGKQDTVGSPFVSGNDLWVPIDEHASYNGIRVSRRGYRIVRGFVEGNNPEALEDVGIVNIGGEPQEAGVTLEELRLAIKNDTAFRHDLKNAIKSFVGEVLAEQKVVTEGMFLDGEHGGSYDVWHQLENTSYSGALNAIHAAEAGK